MLVNGEKLTKEDVEKYISKIPPENELLIKHKIFNGVKHTKVDKSQMDLTSTSILISFVKEIWIEYKDIVSLCNIKSDRGEFNSERSN